MKKKIKLKIKPQIPKKRVPHKPEKIHISKKIKQKKYKPSFSALLEEYYNELNETELEE